MNEKSSLPARQWERRDFLKSSATTVLGLAFARLPVMAGPFTRADFDHLVPADKKLSPAWVKSLFERGTPQVWRGSELKFIGMPVGGIGAGQLYLGGNGRLWHWDIFNQNIATGASHYAKPLTPDLPLTQTFSLKLGEHVVPLDDAGFSEVTFRGEYPVGIVNYADANVPLAVTLEAFSPFIPLNTDDSSLPAMILQFTVRNTSAAMVAATLAGELENAVCLHHRKRGGVLHNRFVSASGATMLLCSAAADAGADKLPDFGTLALALLGEADETSGDNSAAFATELIGWLGQKFTLAPGEAKTVTFVLAWHFPNLSLGKKQPDVGRHYATRFDSAQAVAEYVAGNFPRLAGQTKLWRDTWYDSTLPYWFLDRTFLNTSILATSTSHRFANGRFYGREGVGCCEGTCTSVWFYAQAMGRLFPDLERSVHEKQDFAEGIGFDPTTGGIWTRGEYRGDFVLDGQAGNILRAYREHQMSLDAAFLKRNWPKIKQAMQWLIQQDGNSDGIIDGWQSTTLDCGSWWGAMSWTSSLYLAALRACEEMAKEMGDLEFARSAKGITDVGAKNLVARLWNGEYFIHKPDPSHANSFIIGNGCHIDQVYGQAWAHQVGLGRILPQAQTQSALRSIWKYNFTPDVGPYRQVFKDGRWYAMAGEGGVIMTTWPNGDREYPKKVEGRMAMGVGYLNECMSGFEHQVAGHMIGEGLVVEGLAVERAIHDRHHASRRNPWNEIECGDHYSRAMASYGVFLAACGFAYHGPKQHIGFAPKLTPENFKGAFTSAAGWGSFGQQVAGGRHKAELILHWGELHLKTIALMNDSAHSATVLHGGKSVAVQLEREGKQVLLTLINTVQISAGEKLEIILG